MYTTMDSGSSPQEYNEGCDLTAEFAPALNFIDGSDDHGNHPGAGLSDDQKRLHPFN
jgi:hypothetical protein